MRGICPNCEKKTELEFIETKEAIQVKGDSIEIEVQFYKCSECGEEFDDPKSGYDPLDKAYREYRCRHNMLQPEEIRNLRKSYGLTQREMSKILGWGGATLSRYENGALQDETHEKTLRLAMDPKNLRKLIEGTPEALSEEKRNQLIKELKELESKDYSFERIYEERFGNYEGSIQSGYMKLNLAKLFNAILFFCKDGIIKTKLGKLLFYADFKHFQQYSVSITGAKYAHCPFGPIPNNYVSLYAALIEEKIITITEKMFSPDISGEVFTATRDADLSIFSETELKILATVKEYFKSFSAKEINDFSHEEKGYKETKIGKIISYDYANQLKF